MKTTPIKNRTHRNILKIDLKDKTDEETFVAINMKEILKRF